MSFVKYIGRNLYWRFKSAWWAFNRGDDVKEMFEGGPHGDPKDCPSFYDGCNCYNAVWDDRERLLKILREIGPNDIMKKII